MPFPRRFRRLKAPESDEEDAVITAHMIRKEQVLTTSDEEPIVDV